MDSSDFSRQILFQPRFTFFFQFRASVRPPRVRTTTFVSCSRRVYCNTSGQYWTLPCFGDSSGITAYYTISVRRLETLPGGKLFFPSIRLPSDSASRRTPLPSANGSYCQARSGLSPPSCCPCRAHKNRRVAFLLCNAPFSYSVEVILY